MKVTREEQRTEALRRLKNWETDELLTQAFEHNELAISERFAFAPGVIFIMASILDKKDILTQIRAVEEEYGILVYTVIKTNTEFGELYDCLYVSSNKEDWELDEELREDNVAMSYCINISIPDFSEFGSIGVGVKPSGLYRTQ